jgi:hypothetical protein
VADTAETWIWEGWVRDLQVARQCAYISQTGDLHYITCIDSIYVSWAVCAITDTPMGRVLPHHYLVDHKARRDASPHILSVKDACAALVALVLIVAVAARLARVLHRYLDVLHLFLILSRCLCKWNGMEGFAGIVRAGHIPIFTATHEWMLDTAQPARNQS